MSIPNKLASSSIQAARPGVYNYDRFADKEESTAVFQTCLHAGDDAPDFELKTTEDKRVRLSQFRGHKNVLLHFGSIT